MYDEYEAKNMCIKIQEHFNDVEELLTRLGRQGYRDAGQVYENLFYATFWLENMMTLFD